MKPNSNKISTYYKINILFVIIIFFQLAILIHYMSIRTVINADETWSFGLANSYDYPLFWEDGGGPSPRNDFYNKWYNGNKWFNYITVQPNETFAFDRVYNNQKKDLSPPLYYMLIHFVCSLFPNTFSPWFGYIINIIAFIITQFFLFKLLLIINFNDKTTLVIVSFFGFSMAAINTFLYIRMYSLLTMFVIMLNYYVINIITDENISLKNGIFLFIIGFLGFLTQHYFAFFFFAISIAFILIFITRKRYSLLLKYIIISLLSFIAYYLCFPYVFSHIHNASYSVTSNGLMSFFPLKELLTGLCFIINYTLGISLEKTINIFKEISNVLDLLSLYIKPYIVILILFISFYFIFKKDKYNKINIILFEFITVLILTSCYTILSMRVYFGRYYFALLPLFCIIVFKAIESSLQKMNLSKKIKEIVSYTLIVIFVLASHKNSAMEYCFTNKPSRDEMAFLFKGSSIISVQKRRSEHTIHTKAQEYMYSKRVFPTRENEFKEIEKAVVSISSEDKNYIVVPENEYGLLIVNMLKQKGVKPRYLFTDNHPNYDQMVFESYANKTNNK